MCAVYSMHHQGKRSEKAHARRRQQFNQFLVAKNFINNHTIHDCILDETVCKCSQSDAYDYVCAVATEINYSSYLTPHGIEAVEQGLVLSNSTNNGSRQLKHQVIPPLNYYYFGSTGWHYRSALFDLLKKSSDEAVHILIQTEKRGRRT
jgi:hypothetical protein